MKGKHSILLRVEDLKVHFQMDEGTLKAVDGVSFSLEKGKTMGLVGESGCGKSVTSQAIMRIVPSPGITSGSVFLSRSKNTEPIDLGALDPDGKQIRAIRGKDITMIFQEPMTSFSPLLMGKCFLRFFISNNTSLPLMPGAASSCALQPPRDA